MAIGDILSATVRSTGWDIDLVIEGFVVGSTYDFGSCDNAIPDLSATTVDLTVVSEGYNSAGVLGVITRTLHGTHVVRKPYPLEAQLDETVPVSDLVVRVSLNENIYNDDKNGGAGTSGTDPTITILAGFVTNTGGSSETSTAVTALAVTNNSTLDYPKVIGQWDWETTPAWSRVEADFEIGFRAFHGHNIAAVALSAIGSTSAHSQASTITSSSTKASTKTGLYHESYKFVVPIAGYTQAENITLNAVAYPLVGDADSLMDTSTNADIWYSINGYTEITCTCDKSGGLKRYAVIDIAGNDATGSTSITLSTAEATPYLTIAAALLDNASIIYVNEGTFDIVGGESSGTVALDYMREVSPHPSVTQSLVILNRGGAFKWHNATKLKYKNFLSITCSVSAGYLTGTSTMMTWFDSCSFNTTVTPSAGLAYKFIGTWFINCDLDGRDHFTQSNLGAMYSFTGCQLSYSFTSSVFKTLIACQHDGIGGGDVSLGTNISASVTQPPDNIVIANNTLYSMSSTSPIINIGDTVATGLVIGGNIVEVMSGVGKNIELFADANTNPCNNVIFAHNTFIGNRTNLFYNDIGAVAVLRTNCFVVGNAVSSYNIKADLYGTPDGSRVGNWASVNGVNYTDNVFDMTAAFSFTNDFNGINCFFHTALALEGASTDLGFTDGASAYGTGLGGGDYAPDTGSVLKDHTLTKKLMTYDMNGISL